MYWTTVYSITCTIKWQILVYLSQFQLFAFCYDGQSHTSPISSSQQQESHKIVRFSLYKDLYFAVSFIGKS